MITIARSSLKGQQSLDTQIESAFREMRDQIQRELALPQIHNSELQQYLQRVMTGLTCLDIKVDGTYNPDNEAEQLGTATATHAPGTESIRNYRFLSAIANVRSAPLNNGQELQQMLDKQRGAIAELEEELTAREEPVEKKGSNVAETTRYNEKLRNYQSFRERKEGEIETARESVKKIEEEIDIKKVVLNSFYQAVHNVATRESLTEIANIAHASVSGDVDKKVVMTYHEQVSALFEKAPGVTPREQTIEWLITKEEKREHQQPLQEGRIIRPSRSRLGYAAGAATLLLALGATFYVLTPKIPEGKHATVGTNTQSRDSFKLVGTTHDGLPIYELVPLRPLEFRDGYYTNGTEVLAIVPANEFQVPFVPKSESKRTGEKRYHLPQGMEYLSFIDRGSHAEVGIGRLNSKSPAMMVFIPYDDRVSIGPIGLELQVARDGSLWDVNPGEKVVHYTTASDLGGVDRILVEPGSQSGTATTVLLNVARDSGYTTFWSHTEKPWPGTCSIVAVRKDAHYVLNTVSIRPPE